MSDETVTALRQCTFFEDFQPRHMDKLMTLGSAVTLHENEIIFRQNEESVLFYFIVSGRVGLETKVGDRTVRVQTLYPGDELGWSAVLKQRRHFQARALEPVQLMAFEISVLREACAANPYFGCAFLERLFRIVAERLESTRLQLAAALAEQQFTSPSARS